jgi:hypothetical protein
MTNILIIGAGQLGSRHLQGALLSKYALKLTVVDLSEESLKVAESRASEVELGNKDTTVKFSSSLTEGSNVDICIIATTASVRFKVLEELVSKCNVGNIIFEKVLFQAEYEYAEAKKLLDSNNINAWVNCPRRIFPTYNEVKQLISSEKNISMTVKGTNWGMACNSIHFIDLFSYITEATDFSLGFSRLQENVIPSKRGGYYEVNGIIQGESISGHTFTLECRDNDKVECLVEFKTNNYEIIVKETSGIIIIEHNGKKNTADYLPQFQSQLTGKNIEEIIETSASSLTTFNDSCSLHLPFIRGIKKHIEKGIGESLAACPIT